MYITTRNNHTKISKNIYVMKVLHADDVTYSLDVIPYTVNVEFTLVPEEDFKEKDVSYYHSLNYHKINFMLEAVFDNAIVFDPKVADFVLKNCMDVDNPLVYIPNTGDACLNVVMHSKFKAITEHCYIGNVEILDLRTNTSYNYIDDELNYEYLPTMDEMVDGIKFNEIPWWFRNDISTYDGSAKDQEEYDRFMDEHYDNTQIAVTDPFVKIEEKVKTILNPGTKETGEIINLDEFKKKTWKPKIV
tara:strand:- start:688 stop:1425 length:738 start_codon:yes stop_codon:yes gene_type:complete